MAPVKDWKLGGRRGGQGGGRSEMGLKRMVFGFGMVYVSRGASSLSGKGAFGGEHSGFYIGLTVAPHTTGKLLSLRCEGGLHSALGGERNLNTTNDERRRTKPLSLT